MQIKKTHKVYDVVVIGSGASGGMAAWNLTRQGVKVLLLDAGRSLRPRQVLDGFIAV
jgi:choline dehydrogenase-like flavoprotein